MTNFKIQRYNRNESKCNDVYSRNYLSKIKDGEFVINLDECKSIGIHWIALYVSGNNVIYFDIFGVQYILIEIKKFVGNKNMIANIYRMQTYNSVMRGCFSIVFITVMLYGNIVLDYTNLLPSNKYKKNKWSVENLFQTQTTFH